MLFKISLLLLAAVSLIGCTEQYILQTNTFESALVVEATITNEFKQQEIRISRTYRLEENLPTAVDDAEVIVTDSDGHQYLFEQTPRGYVSTEAFSAVAGKTYRLKIITSEGKSYTSTVETLSPVNEIQSIVPAVQTKDGLRGVAIHVNSFDPANTSKYYRYEYEETYKIIAPFWSPDKAITVPGENPDHDDIVLIPRGAVETRVCYTTAKSEDILLATTASQNEDRVDFPIRFISDKSSIISTRYSIKVRQYVQNLSAYTFYKMLKTISSSGESILSQNQPGFFYGNMKSTDNPDEKVIGYFEVASVSEKRIFFNYEELFPGEQLPPYFADCTRQIYKLCFTPADPVCKGAALLSAIDSNSLLYYANVNDLFYMVAPMCGDCTSFSSNVVPPFWE